MESETIEIKGYKDKRVGIVGYGISGRSSAEVLRSSGAEVLVWDDNIDVREQIDASKFSIADNPADTRFERCTELVISPGIECRGDNAHEIVKRGLRGKKRLSNDISLFFRQRQNVNIIVVTGTNGKTTLTSLIEHTFRECKREAYACGNNGKAALLAPYLGDGGYYILELSSYHLELLTELPARIAVMTNITQDHQYRYSSFTDYISTKGKIFSLVGNHKRYGVFNFESRECAALYLHLGGGDLGIEWIPIPSAEALDKDMEKDIKGVISRNSRLSSFSIRAVVAIALLSGIGYEVACQGVGSFMTLKHRMQSVGRYGDIEFINDSKATNPEATAFALGAREKTVIHWLAGGRAKSGDMLHFYAIEEVLRKQSGVNVQDVYLFGESAQLLFSFLGTLKDKNIFNGEVFMCDNLEAAFNLVISRLFMGSKEVSLGYSRTVILSPACASFDQFKSFEERGERFISLVDNFITNHTN